MSSLRLISVQLLIVMLAVAAALPAQAKDYCPWDATGPGLDPDGMVTYGWDGTAWWEHDVEACYRVMETGQDPQWAPYFPRCDVDGDGRITLNGDVYPIYYNRGACPETSPLLMILLDFADTDMATFLPNPDTAWAGLMFGLNQGEGNHYWNEATGGQFQLQEAEENFGVANDGVIRVTITAPSPTGAEPMLVHGRDWYAEALDLAATYVDFAAYDTDLDGVLTNRELAVMFVVNIVDKSVYGGAWAIANHVIDHPVQGSGPVVEKVTFTDVTHTSIGVNMHELGHHMLGLKHFVWPTHYGLMGQGSYGEDPEIGRLHSPSNHWGTRPTHMMSYNNVKAGFTTPSLVTESTQITLEASKTDGYNVVTIPVVDGMLYLEYRQAVGYDASIPFGEGHTDGLFVTEAAQYVSPVPVAQIDWRRDTLEYTIWEEDRQLPIHYANASHNNTFSYGGYTFSDITTQGTTMTLNVTKENVVPEVANYKFQYFITDPYVAGYQRRHFVTTTPGQVIQVDFSEVSRGDDASQMFPFWLDAFYTTGEKRTVAHQANWTSSSSYLNFMTISSAPNVEFPGGGVTQIRFNESAPYEQTAIVDVEYNGDHYTLELINLPAYP